MKNTPPAIPPASAVCSKCHADYTSDSIGATCPLMGGTDADENDWCDGVIIASDENTSRAPHAFDRYDNDKGMWKVYDAHAATFAWVFPWNMRPFYNA